MFRTNDFLADARVRAQVVEILFRNSLAGPPVVILAASVLWWVYVAATPAQSWPLGAALALWVLENLGFLGLHFVHRGQPATRRQDAALARRYLQWYFWFCVADSVIVAGIAVMLYFARPELVFVPALGIVTYVYGAIVSAMPFTLLISLMPVLILTPITAAFLVSGTLPLLAVAGFFILNVLGLTLYGRSQAQAQQLTIQQRFDLELLTRQLTQERERAHAANESKSRFFTAASHDARQPLQAISLLFEALKRRLKDHEAEQHLVDKISSNLHSLHSLFDRVLDISRIDAGAVVPRIRPVALQPLFDRLEAQYSDFAASRGLWLRFLPTKQVVLQDEALLERMLSNLVHNALKYTERGGVWIGWRNSRRRIEVRDTGQGIAASDQSSIFEEFNRVSVPMGGSAAGLGLGLSIVRRLCELSGARHGLVSSPGRGSTFWLGLEPDHDGAPAPAALPGLNATANTSGALLGVNVLFVEDHPDLLELIAAPLRELGATVHACANALQATTLAQGLTPIDIILADYHLGPDVTGLDVVLRARAARQRDIPALLLSGDTAVKMMQAIRETPRVHILHKPTDVATVVQAMRHQLAAARPA